MKQAFQTFRRALLEAPALALPNPNKPFQLFVDEKQKIRKGVLMQQWRPWKRPVTYLSKRLDPVGSGWPPCLHIIAASALLVLDANKLTYRQQLWVYTPHAIEGVLKQPPVRCWLRPWRLENLILPAILGCHLCEHLHTTTHLGEKKTLTLLQTACLGFLRQNATVREIIQACKACQLMRTGKRQHTGRGTEGKSQGNTGR